MSLFDYDAEIAKLEDKKWSILLTKGERACDELWKPIDAKLSRLYVWKTNHFIKEGRERELPFHRRNLK